MIDVTAGIILSGQKVLLAKRKEGKSLAGWWEFPGGKIENGEEPEEALVRELQEEFEIKVEVVEKFYENIYHYNSLTVRLKSFLVRYISGEYQLHDHSAIRWVDISDILDYQLAPADIPIANQLVSRYASH